MEVTREGIERIRQANPIEAVLAERGIDLKKKGKGLFALCPFHKEKTPSFSVSPGKGLYRCFSCNESGDVIGFVVKHDKVSFPGALETLARRAGLDLTSLMERTPRAPSPTPLWALTPPPVSGSGQRKGEADRRDVAQGSLEEGMHAPTGDLLSRVVDHYHKTFCERADAREYLRKRGLTDVDLLRAHKVGYADGSLLKLLPRSGDVRAQLLSSGVITAEGRELLGGCVVVPIPDPLSGEWTTLYGRGMKTDRHCYLPGPLRGVLNFQAAKSSEEVILTESILDALSFHQAGIATAIPLYGTNGFTSDHLDLLKREGVRQVILALDNDEPGRKATLALTERLLSLGISVRVACFPSGIKDANELLVSRNGDAGEVLRRILDGAEAEEREYVEPAAGADPAGPASGAVPALPLPAAGADAGASLATHAQGELILERRAGGITPAPIPCCSGVCAPR